MSAPVGRRRIRRCPLALATSCIAARSVKRQAVTKGLARISQTVGASRPRIRRKYVVQQQLSLDSEVPRCKQTVSRICLNLNRLKDVGWWLLSTAKHHLGMLARRCLAQPTGRSVSIDRFAACFRDARRQDLIEHEVKTLIGQRVFGLALGYEDLNDHDHLRHDPVMAILAGKLEARRKDRDAVAGKSTLNRLEFSRPLPTRYHKISHDAAMIERLPVDLFVEAHRRPPKQIILDLDATDDPLHGHQEGRFFHGYYDCYCYLPLYVFCGRHLLAAKLRKADIDASAGAVEEIARIVAQIRARWPHTRILLRADSGFAREALMAWCEANRVDYLFGLARNARLAAMIERELAAAKAAAEASGKPVRRFKEFSWTTLDSWSRERRVIAKAEWTQGEANPRFVVTSLSRRRDRRPASLREGLLRPRRHGEPDQGMPSRPVRRPHLDRNHARQSAAAVVCLLRLHSLVRRAPHRPQAHAVRQGQLRNHPSQVAQDRRAGETLPPPHQARHGLILPQPARIPDRPRPARRSGDLTNQTAHSRHNHKIAPPIRRPPPCACISRHKAFLPSSPRHSAIARQNQPSPVAV